MTDQSGYPTDRGVPLLLFKPEPSPPNVVSDAADEYAVFALPREHGAGGYGPKTDRGGVIVFARYGDRWVANSGERYVIAHLLSSAGAVDPRPMIAGVLDAAEADTRKFTKGLARNGFAGTRPFEGQAYKLTVYDELRRAFDLPAKERT